MKAKKYLKINDIESYRTSFHLSNYVWNIVMTWDYFAKDTVGKQFVNAMDSISVNIAEGFGRYEKKDKMKFYRYSYGSITECLNWNEKAKIRKLIIQKEYAFIFQELQKLPKSINHLINFTEQKLKN